MDDVKERQLSSRQLLSRQKPFTPIAVSDSDHSLYIIKGPNQVARDNLPGDDRRKISPMHGGFVSAPTWRRAGAKPAEFNPESGPGPAFRLAGRTRHPVPVPFSGCRPVIRYLASGSGPVFWLSGRYMLLGCFPGVISLVDYFYPLSVCHVHLPRLFGNIVNSTWCCSWLALFGVTLFGL